ncbi:hypothetical protein FRC01_000007 [Tulasnella sp. 417]|nr:hypothetical protein FRC01_000007 [Tulasnella sp. 417]
MALAAAALALLNVAAMPATAFLIPRATNTNRVSIPLGNVGNTVYTAGVKMGADQEFAFSLDLNMGYTVVAGPNCQDCVTNSSLPSYNPNASSTFVAQNTGGTAATIQTNIAGKPIAGALGTENCALQKQDGTWWNYPNQTVIVAGSDSDSQALGPASGVAGFGQTAAQSADQTLVGQYLAGHTDISSISFGLALNPLSDPNAGSDSSGGTLHVFQPDTSFYTGNMVTLPVANANQQSNFGAVPNQIGSYDWTVQMQGWSFVPGQNQQAITGGGGVYATVEASYPYIVLTAADAQRIYGAIPGAQPYTIPANAVTGSGTPVGQDTSTQSYSFPCTTNGLSLSVSFGDVSIPVDANDLLTKIGDVCVGNVRGWTDTSRGTYIFGSSFLRNAYIVLTANGNPQSNTIGLAARAFAAKQGKSNTGAIVGGVIGGLAFIAIVAAASFFYIRHRRRQNEIPPSAEFAVSGDLNGGGSSEKHHSLLGFMSKDRNADNLAAEPWTPPPGTAPPGSTEGGHDAGNIVVQPWTPNAPGEQAFLSPMGAAFPATTAPASTSPGPTATSFAGHTPPPPSSPGHLTAGAQPMTPPPGSPGVVYGQPLNGSSYSPVPNPTGQAIANSPTVRTPPATTTLWNVSSTATDVSTGASAAATTSASHPTHVERGISGELSDRVEIQLRPGAQTYNGRGTFFAPGLGACGTHAGRGDAIVALNSGQYGDMSKTSKHCFRKIRIMNTENSKSQVAVIQAIAAGGLDEGVIPLAWHFIDEEMKTAEDAPKHKPRPKPKTSAHPTTKSRKVHTEAAATSFSSSSSANPSGTFDLFNEKDVATSSSAPREAAVPTLSFPAATSSAIGTAQDLDDESRGGSSGSNLGRMGNLVGRLGYLSSVGRGRASGRCTRENVLSPSAWC